MQRYEGASTLFGPCELLWPSSRNSYRVLISFDLDTLDAYIARYGGLVDYLAPGPPSTPPSDPPPPEQTSKAISLQVC